VSTVELAGLGKRYGRTRALADVDLTFDRGVTGLLGPNGAGKTTLLRIVATSIAADSGEVRLLGRDPHRSHADVTAVRRELGYLPQELGYPSDMTAFGFLEYIAVLKEWNDRKRRAQEVRRVLEAVGLADRATVKIRRLSGGQRRRVGLAQALLGDPRLVVLDEPTTGLDPAQRADLRRTLSTLGHRSTVLLSTHQTEDVAALCERVVVLAGGTVRFDGAVIDLVATAVGRVWLADAPARDALVSWRTGTGRHHVVGGTPPVGADPTEPTLEDAYLLMLGPDAHRVHTPSGLTTQQSR
jgi:ABC-2 type transport system ATP-binding protein